MRMARHPVSPGDEPLARFQLPDILLAGIVVLTVHAQIVSLFGGVRVRGWLWLVVVWAVMILFGLRQKGGAAWKRFLTERFGRKYLKAHAWELLAGGAIFLVYAYGTSHGLEHYDTGLYHAQAIRWIAEAGLMRGLGNLHTRLAYNPSSLALSALFDLNGTHAMAGFMALLLAWKSMGLRGLFRRRRMEMPDAPRLLAVYYLFMIYDEMVSPAPDYFVNCVLLYLVIAWLDAMEDDADEHSYALLCVLAVYAVTLKLSVAPLLLLTVYAVWRLCSVRTGDNGDGSVLSPASQGDKQNRPQLSPILMYFLTGCVVIAPFLIRNYYLSGYLIYPFPAIDLFDVEWKIPQGVAMYDAREIAVYGRGYMDVLRYDEPMWVWIADWERNLGFLDRMFYHMNQIMIPILLLLIIIFFIQMVRLRVRLEWSERHAAGFSLIMVLLVLYLFWFLSAPLVRYGKMILWLPGTLFYGFVIVTRQDKPLHRMKTKHRFLYAALLLFFLYKSAMLIGDDLPRADVRWLTEQQPYAAFALEQYDVIETPAGQKTPLYAPTEGDRVGSELLASPNRVRVQAIGDWSQGPGPRAGLRAVEE